MLPLLYVWCMQHYIFPSGGDGLYLVVDEKSNFRESNFQKAMAVLQVSSQHRLTRPAEGGTDGLTD